MIVVNSKTGTVPLTGHGPCLCMNGNVLLPKQLDHHIQFWCFSQKHKGDHQGVDTKRFDQCQTDNHGNRYLSRRFGVSCNTFNRRFQTQTLCKTTNCGCYGYEANNCFKHNLSVVQQLLLYYCSVCIKVLRFIPLYLKFRNKRGTTPKRSRTKVLFRAVDGSRSTGRSILDWDAPRVERKEGR